MSRQLRVMLIRRFLRETEMLRVNEGAYPKERLPWIQDADKWDMLKIRGKSRDGYASQEA